jgi:twinkle protein
MAEREESSLIKHIPCEECGSSDGNALYTDGHTHCFVCKKTVQHGGETSEAQPKKQKAGFYVGEYQDLVARKITEDTCRKFSYAVGSQNGATVQIAPYFNEEGEIVAQKIRGANKQFHIVGSLNDAQLFGAKLWNKGKKIVVTEGEIDCLTVSQVQGNKWPVVSIPNGAAGAAKAIRRNLEYLNQFDEVIFMFDMDEVGQAAAKECAELLEAGKAKIATLPRKDPNECLKAGCPDEIISAMWNAKTFRPDGVISGSELWDQVSSEEVIESILYPWEGLNKITLGSRKGELVTFTAGSGIGKSAIVREITHHLLTEGQTVGLLMLEENPKRTALGLMGIELSKPLHISREGVNDADLKVAFDNTVGSNRLYLYNHFGSSDLDNLLSRIRYLARGCGCDWIVLDHLSIVVSGIEGGDERRLIDLTMTMLRTLVEETGIGLFLVSHLKRPEGKSHEEGGKTSLAQLRGSHAIAQLSDMVIGLERDQQGDNPNVTTLRVLKNRFTGQTGEAGQLLYTPETGRLSEHTEVTPFTDQTNKDY